MMPDLDPRRYPAWWRGYLVLCIAAALLNAGLALAADPGTVMPARWLGVGFGFIALPPLFGYVAGRRVPPRPLWFAVLAIAIFVIAAMLAVAIAHASLRSLLALPAAALGFPYLYALQQYLHHSPHIWQGDRAD